MCNTNAFFAQEILLSSTIIAIYLDSRPSQIEETNLTFPWENLEIAAFV